jgi:NCAIR mutase (PurE)-related protein
MDRTQLLQLLSDVRDGGIAPRAAALKLERAPFDELGFATIDHHRMLRDGLPEVILAAGKTPEQVAMIGARIYARSGVLLATRIDGEQTAALQQAVPGVQHDRHARIAWATRTEVATSGHVAVVTAGTSDIPVAEEAAITATLMGARVTRHFDVGVAGIHRVTPHLDQLRAANVLIIVAGMDGALPSVIGGLVRNPIIAVPTSTGYGAAFGGLAALLTMLNSCATGVSVVNIDNGFGAGYIAATINALAVRAAE